MNTETVRADMSERFGKVAVLYGGTSAEREISLISGAAVLKALLARGVNATGLDVGPGIIGDLSALAPDRVFIVLHGPGGEDGTLQGALEFLRLPYTGSGVLASALAMDKMRTKQLWKGMGLPTAGFAVLDADSDWSGVLASLGGAAMVKPTREGSSIGMARAATPAELENAWRAAAALGDEVIAEAWLSGAEYTVAILDGEALPPIKLETDRGFYDYEAKYAPGGSIHLLRTASGARGGTQGPRPGGVRQPRLYRLGPGRPDAGWRRRVPVAGGQHGAGHDRPQPGAHGGPGPGHRLR